MLLNVVCVWRARSLTQNNSTDSIKIQWTSYRQVLCWVQIDHEQCWRQSVIGQAPVCAHTSQHLIGQVRQKRHWERSQDNIYCWKTRKFFTWSNFSGVESRDSHSSFKWSFPVGASSKLNHCNSVTSHNVKVESFSWRNSLDLEWGYVGYLSIITYSRWRLAQPQFGGTDRNIETEANNVPLQTGAAHFSQNQSA